MLTPIEIQNRQLKTGIGYKKNEVDEFMEEIYVNYESVYKENAELKEQIKSLQEGMQYYKDLEKTLQKTLIIAEKTAEETRQSAELRSKAMEEEAKIKSTSMIEEAKIKAASMEEEARIKATSILESAKKDYVQIYEQIDSFVKAGEQYRAQFKQLASAQLALLDSHTSDIVFNKPDFLKEAEQGNDIAASIFSAETTDSNETHEEMNDSIQLNDDTETDDNNSIEKNIAENMIEEVAGTTDITPEDDSDMIDIATVLEDAGEDISEDTVAIIDVDIVSATDETADMAIMAEEETTPDLDTNMDIENDVELDSFKVNIEDITSDDEIEELSDTEITTAEENEMREITPENDTDADDENDLDVLSALLSDEYSVIDEEPKKEEKTTDSKKKDSDNVSSVAKNRLKQKERRAKKGGLFEFLDN